VLPGALREAAFSQRNLPGAENTIEILAESGCSFLLDFLGADFFRRHVDAAQTETLSALEDLLGLSGGKSWNDPARYPVNDSYLFPELSAHRFIEGYATPSIKSINVTGKEELRSLAKASISSPSMR
jgi:hypothetical protein